ncbi:carboxymuconolactone decarboxylase family protein [Burkholderia pseudomallei]|nr:carboxymuconolactone decarboxylase family protein [Burkholderia pseudomallei]VBQ05916.1 carboxymuconolactone decarboxylase family protein [Burkholderia pseudomallei]VBS86922.1 carboxymuconolactone decarboxylase family protein [Burkholderia pseudomallei]
MALPQSYRELTGEVATQMRALRKTQPDLMSAFAALAAAGTKEGALGKKTRELVALGIAIASRCDDCIGFHVQTLVKLGTTREEFEDLLATAVYMGGGPSMMYAAHALRAVEEFGGSDGGAAMSRQSVTDSVERSNVCSCQRWSRSLAPGLPLFLLLPSHRCSEVRSDELQHRRSFIVPVPLREQANQRLTNVGLGVIRQCTSNPRNDVPESGLAPIALFAPCGCWNIADVGIAIV